MGSGNGIVYALNAATGARIWTYRTAGRAGCNPCGVESSPTVVKGVVYVGGDDGNVYALKASNGTKIWRYPTRGAVVSRPAVTGGTVYVGSEDNYVYALRAKTGAKFWSYLTGDAVVASAAVSDGMVYVAPKMKTSTRSTHRPGPGSGVSQPVKHRTETARRLGSHGVPYNPAGPWIPLSPAVGGTCRDSSGSLG